MSATPPLPAVLSSLVVEYATPSFRLKDDTLRIHMNKSIIEVKAKPGLWFASFGPKFYGQDQDVNLNLPLMRRALLLHHEDSVPPQSLVIPSEQEEAFVGAIEDNILICSTDRKSGSQVINPLLNIVIDRHEKTGSIQVDSFIYADCDKSKPHL